MPNKWKFQYFLHSLDSAKPLQYITRRSPVARKRYDNIESYFIAKLPTVECQKGSFNPTIKAGTPSRVSGSGGQGSEQLPF